MKTLFLGAALAGTMLAGLAGTAAVAQPGGGGGMMMRADTNGDGIISHAEFLAAATERFARMDANKDGKLSGDELRGPMAERAQGGVITREAFLAEANAHFQKLDANHDGNLGKDELQAMMEHFHERGGRGPEGGAGGDDHKGPPPGERGGPGGKLERLDTNHDGRISREEMRADADRHFDKLDTNHDGFLDKAELEAGHKHHGDMPPPPPGADAGQ